MTRGIKNNNPFNIRRGSNWKGLSPIQTDKDFCQFTSVEYGIRAFFCLMWNYRKKYGLITIKDIITRYAPSNENNTKGYIKMVCLHFSHLTDVTGKSLFNKERCLHLEELVVNAGTKKFPSFRLREFAKAVARIESRYILTDEIINKVVKTFL